MIKEESQKPYLKNFSFPKDILNEIEAVKAQLKEEDNFHVKDKDQQKLEDDLDFRFTALTQGLGFHQDDKKTIEIESPKAAKSAMKSTTLYNQNVNLKKELGKTDRADLSPLYNSNGVNQLDTHPLFSHTQFNDLKSERKSEVIHSNPIIEEEKTVAKITDQLSAWAIDLALIVTTLAIAIAITFATLGIYEWDKVSALFTTTEAVTYLAPFFVFFYLFYFTILDREGNRTLGKKLMRIRIISKFDEHLGLTQSFLRAAITLLSSLALGLPLLMDFQGKLTDSMVIKEEF